MGFFDKLKKITTNLFSTFTEADEAFFEELEETLILADMGVETATEAVERLRETVRREKLQDQEAVRAALRKILVELLDAGTTELNVSTTPSVMLFIGVNGVGKTTSIGKVAHLLKQGGKRVLLCAADTFRAAAADQLEIWAERSGCEIVRQHEGADPGAVLFDALQAAKARNVDVVLCDTAGRLHNKKNLMEELKKMNRIIDREFPDAYRENLIVLDGTTGQNALSQAREFGEVANLTGVILTKMDGTAKGGIAVAIQSELNVPVKYIGVGETIEDLQKFNAEEFVNALFDVKTESADEDGGDRTADGTDGNAETAETADGSDENSTDTLGDSAEENHSDVINDKDSESSFDIAQSDSDEGVLSEETSGETPSDEDSEEKPKKKKWFFWK